jgi:hypothetical protein
MIPFQIIYPHDEQNPDIFHTRWIDEALIIRAAGIRVETSALPESEALLYRGGYNLAREWYLKEHRFLNKLEHLEKYLYMSSYLPVISDLSIETFFVDELNDNLIRELHERGWSKAFIKKDIYALEHIGEGKSVWPETSLNEMESLFARSNFDGKYCVRRFVEREVINAEERYWVLNGNIYHRTGNIPKVVHQAAERLNELGSRYYTIDATSEFVVEVNPGESSDRHAVNSAELFASWFKKEFCK